MEGLQILRKYYWIHIRIHRTKLRPHSSHLTAYHSVCLATHKPTTHLETAGSP